MKQNIIRQILAIISKDCDINKYEIFDFDDFLENLNQSITKSNLTKYLKDAEIENYISIKYIDDKVFCATITSLGKQYYLSYANQINDVRKIKLQVVSFLFFVLILAFLGSFLGILFYNIVFM